MPSQIGKKWNSGKKSKLVWEFGIEVARSII
jgi:hypothetical protein